MANTTYFDLVKSCLVEMFYSEPSTWEDTNTTEGIKVKRLLNQALRTIVLGENIPWKFREQKEILVLIPGIREYPKPDGYIMSMRYIEDVLQLYYNQFYVSLPMDTKGQPMMYWLFEGKINLFPIPSEEMNNQRILVRYLTNKCARDKYGVLKDEMECECDEPIIPERFRDILVYAVCKDFRRSINDAASVYYEKKYRETYRALSSDQKLSYDYPDGFDITPYTMTMQDAVLNVFYNPRVFGGQANWQD